LLGDRAFPKHIEASGSRREGQSRDHSTRRGSPLLPDWNCQDGQSVDPGVSVHGITTRCGLVRADDGDRAGGADLLSVRVTKGAIELADGGDIVGYEISDCGRGPQEAAAFDLVEYPQLTVTKTHDKDGLTKAGRLIFQDGAGREHDWLSALGSDSQRQQRKSGSVVASVVALDHFAIHQRRQQSVTA
jgi:hypothetical protein